MADWTRRLADLISSGAAGSTRDALRRSLRSVPPRSPAGGPSPGAPDGARRGTERALRQFAGEVDDPAAEKIAGVLILRERNGGPGLADVLTGLAQGPGRPLPDDARGRGRAGQAAREHAHHRHRAPASLIVGMMLFARTFLSSYSTVFGQVMLVVVAAVFAVALRWMRSLSDPPTRHHGAGQDPEPAGCRA